MIWSKGLWLENLKIIFVLSWYAFNLEIISFKVENGIDHEDFYKILSSFD
jgi:hypothetical protein